jgi:hypothetical protein
LVLWPNFKIVIRFFANETGDLATASGILHIAALVQNDMLSRLHFAKT